MKQVLLTFDLEEFDMPLEYGKTISFKDQIKYSETGTRKILSILDDFNAKATFFTTVVFAQHAPGIISQVKTNGHELASHAYYHSKFTNEHLRESKVELERLSGCPITGFRMPRMMPVDAGLLAEAGYQYNSSINPIYLPGRYNNFGEPRRIFQRNNIVHIPASVTPLVRIPLFWLSFHNLPMIFYKQLCSWTLKSDGYLNLYFHPWEFTDISSFGMPSYLQKNSGDKMINRFSKLLAWLENKNVVFSTMNQFSKQKF